MTSGCVVRVRYFWLRASAVLLWLVGAVSVGMGASSPVPPLPRTVANDNRVAAGKNEAGNLELRLEIREAIWFPESEDGPSLPVYAFAEEGHAPQIPGPLIRVPEGTKIRASVRNRLDRAVIIHGLHAHDGKAQTVTLEPGEVRELAFMPNIAGTYAYWASAADSGIWQGRPFKEDSQLAGAFVVDPKEGSPADRIFVLSAWRDKPRPVDSLDVTTINGKSWPYTEQLTYVAGETVHWRVLNLSSLLHPMHLHGGYFRVVGTGDGEQYHKFAADQVRTAATELLTQGRSMNISVTFDRPGRWLFHCHILAHITRDIMLFHQQAEVEHAAHSASNHMNEMSGLVLGLTVKPSPSLKETAAVVGKPRRLTLVVGKRTDGGMGYGLLDSQQRGEPALSAPGPPLVLTRGEPVEIRVINRLSEPTSVHWHGIELESYYDGVPGWTGLGSLVTPGIAPGKSFVARFTPPRAGTFIYHTHMDDVRQMSSGLYGALIVLPPGEKFRPDTDRVFVIGHSGRRVKEGNLLLNGATRPAPLLLKGNTTYRFRFINISPNATVDLLMTAGGENLLWREIAKDGADLPQQQAVVRPAKLPIAPGETYDFELRTGTKPLELSLTLPVLRQTLKQAIVVGGDETQSKR